MGSNEMVSTPFQREDRYIVIKRSDLELLSPNDRDLALTDIESIYSLMSAWDCPPRQFLVIESDWPEFEPTWAAIEARVTGKPAEQHQGEPVGEVVAFGKGLHEIAWASGRMPDLGAKLYTHADPGEVERLREGIRKHWKVVCDQRAELETLRAQLREQDALLDQAYQRDIGTPLKRKIRALSASAEPSAPIAWHVGGNGYDRVCFDMPTDLPGQPCIQPIHGLRQLIDLLKRYDLRDEDLLPDERAHGIPGTSFQRLNALANQGE